MGKKILGTYKTSQLLKAIEHGKGIAFGDYKSAKEYQKQLWNERTDSAAVRFIKGDKELYYVVPLGRQLENGSIEDFLKEEREEMSIGNEAARDKEGEDTRERTRRGRG